MIELISIICSLAICILTPMEVNKIRNGWVRKRFAGDRVKFLAAYRQQLKLFTGFGIVFGVIGLVLASLETEPGEPMVKLIAAVIWLAVAVICFLSLRKLPTEAEIVALGATSPPPSA